MKTKTRESVKIKPDVFIHLQEFCLKTGTRMIFFVSQAVKEKLDREHRRR